MRTSNRKTTRSRPGLRPARRRRHEEATQVHERPAPVTEPEERARSRNGPENRELRTGGPQDRALYICRCGSAFQAVVSASVRCPHCGDLQAW